MYVLFKKRGERGFKKVLTLESLEENVIPKYIPPELQELPPYAFILDKDGNLKVDVTIMPRVSALDPEMVPDYLLPVYAKRLLDEKMQSILELYPLVKQNSDFTDKAFFEAILHQYVKTSNNKQYYTADKIYQLEANLIKDYLLGRKSPQEILVAFATEFLQKKLRYDSPVGKDITGFLQAIIQLFKAAYRLTVLQTLKQWNREIHKLIDENSGNKEELTKIIQEIRSKNINFVVPDIDISEVVEKAKAELANSTSQTKNTNQSGNTTPASDQSSQTQQTN